MIAHAPSCNGKAVYTNGHEAFLEHCQGDCGTDYSDFLASKSARMDNHGFAVDVLHPRLFPFQDAIVRWALRRGRAAIFAGTGLGKTDMQVEWSKRVIEHTNGSVLILAPLAVAQQTVEEATLLDQAVTLCCDDSDVRAGVNITNYDRIHKFDLERFSGVVLDESSILKSLDGKTRSMLIDAFGRTPYRLCCTATPAPNDTMELGNHSEFLGILPYVEMLATYFVHDGGETQKWRLKGHAEKIFWRWVASWAVVLQHPRDIGFDDERYTLPALEMVEHVLPSDASEGALFAMPAQDLMQRRRARSSSVEQRAQWVAEIVATERRKGVIGPWLIWCDLNAEADALAAALPNVVEIRGSDDRDDKERALLDFAHGKIDTLVTKPSIAGFGMNWQVCSNMVFAGISDSYEQLYQAIRRCWRFGQTRPVMAHLVLTETERSVLENLRRKEALAEQMQAAMVAEAMLAFRYKNPPTSNYKSPQVEVPSWLRPTV